MQAESALLIIIMALMRQINKLEPTVTITTTEMLEASAYLPDIAVGEKNSVVITLIPNPHAKEEA